MLVEPDLKGFGSKLGQGLNSLGGVASAAGKGIGLALAAGTAVAAVGFKDVIKLGIEYTGKLNELQAVSGATALEMAQVGAKAKALGADLSLPATSAAGAAAAMLELSKGGLSVSQSMIAAKGTLQLAAAAQIDAASAAEIQSKALNEFGLSADKAGQVADVLANTANAASGGITDIANALKYVGPIARSMGVDITATASAIGLLANNGIQSEQAGTSLRSMLASLASPSKQAAKAMDALNITAFDQHGKFVGLRTIIDQLAKAKHHLTDEEFQGAAANAFGNEALSAINALANEGTKSFDDMAVAVARQGGAADVAAAKMKGLGGAWEGFKSQLETAAIEIFGTIDGPLEKIVRKASDVVSNLTPVVTKGIDAAISAGELFGPGLAQAMASRGEALADVAGKLLRPLAQGLKETLNSAVEIGIRSFQDFAAIVKKTVEVVQPLADGLGRVITSINRADGPIGAFGSALKIAYDVVKGVLGILAPVIGLVGGLVSAFADLPGPIQAAALAILALRVGPSILSGLRGAFSGAGKDADDAEKKTGLFSRTVGLIAAPVKLVASGLAAAGPPLRQFSEEMALQRSLAAASGAEVGKLGASVSAFHTSTIPAIASVRGFAEQMAAIRVGVNGVDEPISRMGAAVGTLVERSPALTAMKDAFHSAADGAGRFGTAAGLASAAGSGLKSAAGGLVSALGGPFGIAIGAVSVGLGFLAGKQEDAARAAADHSAGVDSLASALRDSNGLINDSIRELTAKRFLGDEFKVAAAAANTLKISIGDVVNAALTGGEGLSELRAHLQGIIAAHTTLPDVEANAMAGIQDTSVMIDAEGIAAQNLMKGLDNLAGSTDEAKKKNDELKKAVAEGRGSMLDATDSGRTFAAAMKTLSENTASADDKARALRSALDAFSGGQVGLDQALSHVNEQFDRLGQTFDGNVDKSKGFGDALLTNAGRINTATENGRKLRDSLDEITTSTVNVAQRTFDMTGSLDDAKKVVQENRDRFIAMAGQMGISGKQAEELANQMGLIPEQVVTAFPQPDMAKGQDEIRLLQGLIERTHGKDVVIKSLTDEAKARLEEFGFKVTTLPDGQISVHADTAAAEQNIKDFVNKPRSLAIQARVLGLNAATAGREGLPMAQGGVLRAYADGGLAGLTPMKGGVASIVPPNTWRVVGDRLIDDEAYIPINRSARSAAILQQTADQMGFALLRRFASGGVAAQGTQSTPTSVVSGRAGDVFNIYEQNDPVSTAVTVQRLQTFNARLR